MTKTPLKLKTYFISGILVLAPLFLTIIFLAYLVRMTDRMIVNPVFRFLPASQLDSWIIEVGTKLCIGVLVFLILCLIGYLTQKFLFRRLLNVGDAILKSIPLFNKIYVSIKDIADAFFGDKSGVFKRTVFFEYPRMGMWTLGFVTQEKDWVLCQITGRELASVFLPSPPNPATGMFVFVAKEELIDAGISVEEGLKMAFSLGAVVPPYKRA